MMKKLILFFLVLIASITASAQVIDNPKFKARAGSIMNITRIERTAEATRLHVHAVFRPNWWIMLSDNTYLEDAVTGKRYAFTRAEGIEPNKEVFMPESGQMDFVLDFEPLPQETKTIHWIGPDDSELNTYDILLVPYDKHFVAPLKDFQGNWFSDCDGWALGVYDSVVIADNRIYTPMQVRRHKKGVELTLRDRQSGETTTLQLSARKNGICRLVQDGKRRELTREARPAEVVADNGYSQFFHADTATLQGIIDGYDPRLGFETGLIYVKDAVTGEDTPTVVPIAPDGTFTVRLLLPYSMSLSVVINNQWLPFFLEPGQTQTMYLNWEDMLARSRARDHGFPLSHTQFMGDGTHMSRLAKELSEIPVYEFSKLEKALYSQTPTQFKEYVKPETNYWYQKADSLVAVYAVSQKAVKLIRQSTAVKEGYLLFNFDMYRRHFGQQHPDNEALKVPVEEDYYDFLRRMPLDEPEVLACSEADIFLNRFEYMDILSKVRSGMKVNPEWTEEEEARHWHEHEVAERVRMDSLVAELCGKDNVFLWRVADIHNLKSGLQELDNYEERRVYLEQQKEKLKEYPYLVTVADKIYADLLEEERSNSYELPEGEAADIFRRIIKEHEGKVLFVDFWATTCAPCRSGIEATAELRRKYKDHPDFKFIYITGENDSPRSDYDKYVDKHLKGEACYYLNGKEYNYMRQLFKFNGIPHYEMVEKDGTISRENVRARGLGNYLNERFPLEK